MENLDNHALHEVQQELVKFINPVDAPDIAQSLKRVYVKAFFCNGEDLGSKEKDDLFYLERIIRLTDKMK